MNQRSVFFRSGIILVLCIGLGFAMGFSTAQSGATSSSAGLPAAIQKLLPPGSTTVKTFQTVWDTLHRDYVNKNVDDEKLISGAIAGMVNAVGDPYTVYFNPDEAKSFQAEVSGSFEGIGIELGAKDGHLTVIAPLAASPAERAGIRAGDIIVDIDGTDAQTLSLDEAVKKIRGPQGTSVKLTIQRGTSTPTTLAIVRAHITVDSVIAKTQTIQGKKIGYITITSFTADTGRLFRQAAEHELRDSVDGFVLDLRNNPGGYLDQAVEVASVVMPKGVVVSEVNRDGTKRTLEVTGNAILAGQKIAVLINNGSASASEIVAGAFQDAKVATIIGQTSYGKGTVQELNSLSDGSSLKVTIAKWLTPSGRSISAAGITPDQKVDLTADDVKAGRDPQFDAAIKALWP